METIEKIVIPPCAEGIISSTVISDQVAPEDSVEIAINGHFDRMGSFTTRNGLTEFADKRAGEIISMAGYASSVSGNRRLLVQEDDTIFSWDGATMSNVRTLSNNNKARYSQFVDLMYTVNGNGGDPIQTFNGTSYSTANTGSLPPGDYVQAGFEGRVWVADSSDDKLYYSDIVDPSGVITGGTDFISRFSSQDGQSITALHRVPRALLVFKQNNIYRLYSASSVDPYPAYNVGTYSQESIVDTYAGTFFHHPSGFYRFSFDGQPQKISRRIENVLRAIPRSNYENIVGVWDGVDSVLWSCGALTLDGVDYSNIVVRYHIPTEVWTLYNFRTEQRITSMLLYDSGDVYEPIVGTTSGDIAELEKGKTDLGEPINFDMTSRWYSIDPMWDTVKSITGPQVQSENGAGTLVEFQYDKDNVNKWDKVGTLRDTYSTSFPNFITKDFNRMRVRFKGSSEGTPIVLHTTTFRKLEVKGYDQN